MDSSRRRIGLFSQSRFPSTSTSARARSMLWTVLLLFVAGASVLLSPAVVSGQDGSMRVRPQSPTAASLGEYGDVPVALYTGTPNVTVPLFTVEGRTLAVPLALTYHGGGVRVEEQASWVGLGWSLVAGGTITRTVRGLADDLTNGYYTNGQTFYKNGMWPNPPNATLDKIADGLLDGEPDQFFFNFQGRSGKFVMGPTDSTGAVKEVRAIPYQKLKIVPTFGSTGITQWAVTTEDGTEYTFTARETNTDLNYANEGGAIPAHYGDEHTSAWHLTKIRTVGGDEATFYYTERSTTHRGVGFREKYDHRAGSGGQQCVPTENWMINEYKVDIQVLDSIKTPVQTVHFATSKRTDLKSPTGVQQEYKLDEITVKSAGGTVLRKFDLDTDYALGGRLTLNNVYETDASGTKLPPHTFAYDTNATLPSPTSYDTDHWGFFNDAGNNTPIPAMRSSFGSGTWLSGADRSPDASKVKAGILTKITYPTGGETEFDWEINDYGKIGQSGGQPYDLGPAESASEQASEYQGQQTETFVIGGTTGIGIPVDVTVTIDPDGCGEQFGCPYVEIVNEDGPFTEDTTFTMVLDPGTYQLRAYSEQTGGWAKITVTWRELNAENKKSGGGLRIQEIRNKDGMGNTQTRTFDYTLASDPTRSSGVVSAEPRYDYYFDGSLCKYFSRSSTSKMPLGEGPAVGYSEVTVEHGVNGVYGTTRTTFRSVLDKEDDKPSTSEYPYLRATTYGWMRGQTVEERERNQLGQNQRWSQSTYAFMSTEPTTLRKFRGMAVQQFSAGQQYTGAPATSVQVRNAFEVISEWTYKSKDSTIVYNDDGSNADTMAVHYEYGNPTHVQLTKVREQQRDGTVRVTRMQYPADYGNGTGAEADALEEMRGAAHMHSPVIERWVADSSATVAVYEATLTTFKEYGTDQFLPYQRFALEKTTSDTGFQPSSVTGGAFTKDGDYVKVETAHSYDASGRITQLSDARSKVTNYFYNGGTSGEAFLSAITRVNDGTGSTHLTTSFTYNASGYMSSMRDEGGADRRFEYDGFGRLETIKNDGYQKLEEYAYAFSRTLGNGWTYSASSPNKVTTTTYLSTSPTVTTTGIEYLDGLGRSVQTQVKDGSQYVVTATEYDAQGQMWRQWKPYPASSGGSYQSSYNSAATSYYNTLHSTSAAKPYQEHEYTEDALTRPRRITREYIGGSHQGEFQYRYYLNPGNSRTFLEEIDEAGTKTRTYKDRFGFTVQRTLGFGTADETNTHFTNDIVGRRIESKDPRGLTTDFTWNTRGQLLARDNPEEDLTEFKYDQNGNLRFKQNSDHSHALNPEVVFTNYDFANRPLITGRGTATFSSLNPDGSNAVETPTANWRVVRAYDAKPSTSNFPWDKFSSQINALTLTNTTGRLAAVASYSNGSWQVTLFSYDADGRITKRYVYTHQNGTTNVLTALNATFSYTWDLRNEFVDRHLAVGANQYKLWYDYDDRGLLDEVRGSTSTSKPSSADVQYTHRPSGARASFDYIGGPTVDLRYDIRERLDRIGNPWLTSSKFSAEYGYNWNSTIAWSTQRNTGLSSQAHYHYAYAYDGAKRLKSADYSYWNGSSWSNVAAHDVTNITYDDAGNILTLKRYGQSGSLLDDLTYSYGYNSRLTQVTDAVSPTTNPDDAESGAFAYGWSGKQTKADPYGVSGVNYDYQDRPLSLWKGGQQSKYRYDDAGNRISKQTGSGDVEYYLLDGMTTVAVFTTNSGGTVTDKFFNLITSSGEVFGRDPVASAKLYYYKDLLGTVRAVANTSNVLVESADYGPWGVRMEGRSTGTAATKDGFTGKERDLETGFDYFGARHYMPAIGRWSGPDPLADLFPEWSTYSYVMNNPVGLIDPDGLQACEPPDNPDCEEEEDEEDGTEENAEAEDGTESEETDSGADPENQAESLESCQYGSVDGQCRRVLTGGSVFGMIAPGGLRILGLAGVLWRTRSLRVAWDAAKGVAAVTRSGEVLRHGEWVYRVFETVDGPVEFAARMEFAGSTLVLKDVMIFPIGAEKLNIGVRGVTSLINSFGQEMRSAGFTAMRLQGVRISGAGVGRFVDRLIDLVN